MKDQKAGTKTNGATTGAYRPMRKKSKISKENDLLRKLLPKRAFKELVRCAEYDAETPLQSIVRGIYSTADCTPRSECEEAENQLDLCELRYCRLEGIKPEDFLKAKMANQS